MKFKMAYITLLSVGGILTAAAAETVGFTASSLAYALPFSAFIISLVLLMLSHDYGHSLRRLPLAAERPRLAPAEAAFAAPLHLGGRRVNRRRRLASPSRSMAVRG